MQGVKIQSKWLLGQKIPGVSFKMGEMVEVFRGPLKGMSGTILDIEKGPLFHLELSDGELQNVAQGDLRRVKSPAN